MNTASTNPIRARGTVAVIDLGKTHGRLLLLAGGGECLHETVWRSGTVSSPLGCDALDVAGTEAQLRAALAGLGPLAAGLRALIVTTHGAAVAALHGDALALPVPDYEWAGFDERPAALAAALDPFDDTQSPLLPHGLNLGVQLDWLDRQGALDRVDTLLPYAQYWAWWLSGVRASEASSLGCHTLLWQPRAHRYSHWAQRRGWAQRFAPMRRAWEVLGPVRPALADALGLPRHVQVHVGAHDSNACLARYLRSWPRMTLVSSGTWVVVMAPGAPERRLDEQRGELANVSVHGDCVPTARFMGGREIERLCAGADPELADVGCLQSLLARGPQLPQGVEVPAATPVERATAAGLYAAQVTARLVQQLGGLGPVVLEGPLAHNPVVAVVLSALLPGTELHASTDPVEGTARGGWCLTRWADAEVMPPRVRLLQGDAALAPALREHHARWCALAA